jgi:hypothetical protein
MGDRSTETLKLQSRRDDERYARDHFLDVNYLKLDEDSISRQRKSSAIVFAVCVSTCVIQRL